MQYQCWNGDLPNEIKGLQPRLCLLWTESEAVKDDDETDLRMRGSGHERVHATTAKAKDGEPFRIDVASTEKVGDRTDEVAGDWSIRRVVTADLPAMKECEAAPTGYSIGDLNVTILWARHAAKD